MRGPGVLASSLLLASVLTACGGGAHLDPKVERAVDVAKASKHPAYWLGPRYDGLKLVYAEAGRDAFFDSSFYYSDCSFIDMSSRSPNCHRVIEVDNEVPASGEISSMGRCIFATTIRGLTVATFPVNSEDLRVFSRGATVLVGARKRADSLGAIAHLKPLNGRPLRHRDVSAALGTCKAPAPKPPVHLTAKQRYEQRMKHSFFLESISGVNLGAVDPTAAKPRALVADFMTGTENLAPLLRNEADRIEKVTPPAAVATLQRRLADELRAYAHVVDDVRARAKEDGLDRRKWRAEQAGLQHRIDAAVTRLGSTVQAFRRRGYSIYVRPTD